jgi:hypothetical protein
MYVIKVMLPFQYYTLSILKRQSVTLHQVITVYNTMFDHLDGVMRALANKTNQWEKDLFFAVKFE